MLRKFSAFSFLFILLASVSILTSSASVNHFKIIPENPVKGENIKIIVRASPSEKIPLKIAFEKDLSVVDGRYKWKLSSVKIPEYENRFTVTARNVENLNIAVKVVIWITKSEEAEDAIAKVSQSNLPAGNYDVKISGRSNFSKVRIKVEAVVFLKADKNGNFEYIYDTDSIPPGRFVIAIGGIAKEIELLTKPMPTHMQTSPPVSKTTHSPTPTPRPAFLPTLTGITLGIGAILGIIIYYMRKKK